MPASDVTEIVRKAQEIARDVAASHAAAVDRDARWPEETMRALKAAGLGGLVVPEQYGGLGHGLLALTQVCEALGRACASSAICFGMHSVATAILAAKPTADQAERYLVPIARGQHLTTLALSEPGTGAHFYFPQTALVAHDDGYDVSGTKSFVTNGAYADSYVVSTRATDPAAGPGQFSLVVIPKDARGLAWGASWRGVGLRGNAARALELRDVWVPRADLLGGEGEQIWYVFNVVVPFFLMAMSGAYVGIAGAAVDDTLEHLRRRRYSHSGAALAEQPVLQHRLGAQWATVERTRCTVYRAAALADAAAPQTLPALFAAKADVADCVVQVTNEAMTLAGGRAYEQDAALARHLRDARAAHVMAPTTDVLRVWTARALLGLPLLGD